MAVSRTDAVTGEQLTLTITFREDETGNLFDPYSIEQVDILAADGQTIIETIGSGSITKISLGVYEVTTTSTISSAGLVLDRWMYRIDDGGVIYTAIETTNVAPAPSHPSPVESQNALPRGSAVVLRPILLTMEFRYDKTGELFDPHEVRQVDILENDGATVIESIASITRIGLGRYRIQASAVSSPKTILDKWYFTAESGEEEQFHIQDTQVYDQAALSTTELEQTSVPERLYSDVFLTDQEIVLLNTVEKIGVTFKDTTGTAIDPAALSLNVTGRTGNDVLTDVYLPTIDRNPDPPRILNPSPGRFEFPFGLDNGSSDSSKKNKTNRRCDLIFNWKASSQAAVKANVTIDPGVNPDSSITWTAVAYGTPGNFISVTYVDPGSSNASLSLSRDGANIEVSLATDSASNITTTANDIVAAVTASGNEDVAEIVDASIPTGETGTGVVAAVSSTDLTGGIDASEELVVSQNVKVISHQMRFMLQKLRLQIDKASKLVSNEDPDDPCFLGYTEGQLITYLEGGIQAINAYQPSGVFTFDNYPYNDFSWTLVEASLLVGVMSQQLFAVDTDVPNWSDQGNTFVIQHQPQLVQYLNWLAQRLDKMIPMMKLNFVTSGSLHIEAGPNFRLTQLLQAAPHGSLFRNTFSAS